MPIKWKTAIITLSDKGYAGEREDKSGPLVREMIERAGYEVTEMVLLPDERMMIEEKLKELCDERETDLILTTGGTGFSPRDCTPEATLAVAERNAPGIAEAMRYASLQVTPRAMLRSAVSTCVGNTLTPRMTFISSVRPVNLDILGVVLPQSQVLWSMLVRSFVRYLKSGIASFASVVNTSSPVSPSAQAS